MSQSKTIIAAAAACFAQHKAIQELYVTEDGNAFMPHVQGLAVSHARMHRLPEPVLVKRDDEGMAEAIAQAGKGRKATDEQAAAPPAPEAGAEPAESTATTEGGEGAEAPADEVPAKGKKGKK